MMTDTNEMNACDASRRKLLKTTATVAGLAAISPAISLAKGKAAEVGAVSTAQVSSRSDQHRYIASVLNKYAAKSKRVKPEHIDRFAKGFIEMNGDIDYKQTFNKLDGEYKLVKLFMKSMNASA